MQETYGGEWRLRRLVAVDGMIISHLGLERTLMEHTQVIRIGMSTSRSSCGGCGDGETRRFLEIP